MKTGEVIPIKHLCAEYAQGKITFQQFERGIDRLVEERSKAGDAKASA